MRRVSVDTEDTVAVIHHVRTELAGVPPAGRGQCLLALAVMSDVQVLDTASPARCEWVAQLEADPVWQPLHPMHRPYEALAHWAMAAHVAAVRRKPAGAWGGRRYDLALSLGDTIDNAQHNELDVFLAIMAAGHPRLSAHGGAQDPSGELGPGPWPYWCPDAGVVDLLKPRGWPVVPDFLHGETPSLGALALGDDLEDALHAPDANGVAAPAPRRRHAR